MPDSTIMGVVVLFIGIVILIGLTPIILGNTAQSCDSLDGYNATDKSKSTGWAKSCVDTGDNSQDSFNVILVIPVIVAAVAILMVVRFL